MNASKLIFTCVLSCCGLTVLADEPFTMTWIHSVSYTPKGEDGRDHPTPDVIAGELPAFGKGLPEYKVEGIRGESILPVGRGSGYRRRTMPYAKRNGNLRTKPYGFTRLFPRPDITVDSPYARSGKPFFIYERMSRPPFFLPRNGAPLADRADYAAWKKAHPGFIGFNSIWEFDSDSEGFERGCGNIADETLKSELNAAFPRNSPSGMAHRVEWARTAFKLAEDFHFGEKSVWPLCSFNPGYEHIFAACGAAGLWYEATGQHIGAWNVAAAFLRGAARQYGLDYGWYMAHYRVGHNRKHKLCKGDRGISLSLHRRQVLIGWLSGAKYLKTEGWPRLYIEKKDGKWTPTDYAREFNTVYEVASGIDRGEPYTPLAVLTPLAEPCDSNYLRRNGRLLDPKSQTDVFDTLVPIRGDNGKDSVSWGLGEQGCLYNSEFGGFFDVLCPDSGQDSARFAQALARYRHVLLVSDKFDKAKFDSAALSAFEQAGGKVHRYPSAECGTKEQLRELLLKIQSETMPVVVDGDIQWGVNKTENGWLVYLINNKGVRSYFGEKEELLKEHTANVTVTVKATGRKISAKVEPGGYKLIEIAESTGDAGGYDDCDRQGRLVPRPKNVSMDESRSVKLDGACRVEVSCAAAPEEAVKWVAEHFKDWFGCEVKISVDGVCGELPTGDEAYAVEAADGCINLRARTLSGVKLAVHTLRQLADPIPGTMRLIGYEVPYCRISDSPSLAFRAAHVCWFPENDEKEIERFIRLAAGLKFNYVVIEPWGVYRSKKYPALGWRDGMMTPAAVRRLKSVADDLGVTLVPQFNIFGHATMSRIRTGKHATLDLTPEYQPLFEPRGGWNWCLSNPATLRVHKEIIDEMLELFGDPPYFHIGCDEAEPPTCRLCRSVDYVDSVHKHITAVYRHLAERGVKTLMWHDMLLDRGDPRWKGFRAKGNADTARLAGMLPREIVLCNWYYGKAPVDGKYPTLEYFKKLGYPVVVCPWDNAENIIASGRAVEHAGGMGVMATVWHHGSGLSLPRIFSNSASAAWGTAAVADRHNLRFADLWRKAVQDCGITAQSKTGFNDTQVTRDILSQ